MEAVSVNGFRRYFKGELIIHEWKMIFLVLVYFAPLSKHNGDTYKNPQNLNNYSYQAPTHKALVSLVSEFTEGDHSLEWLKVKHTE